MAAWERFSRASGSPTCSTASAAATATSSARGSALPMSSEASTIMRRAIYRGSSPPSRIAARFDRDQHHQLIGNPRSELVDTAENDRAQVLELQRLQLVELQS